jgi:hypothetical protein
VRYLNCSLLLRLIMSVSAADLFVTVKLDCVLSEKNRPENMNIKNFKPVV